MCYALLKRDEKFLLIETIWYYHTPYLFDWLATFDALDPQPNKIVCMPCFEQFALLTHTHLSTNLLHPMPLNLIFLMNIKFINLSHWFEELCRHNIIFYICLVLLLISMHYVCSKWHWITLHNEQTIHYIIIIKPKLYFMSPMVRTTGIRRYINSDKAKCWININSILESMGRK